MTTGMMTKTIAGLFPYKHNGGCEDREQVTVPLEILTCRKMTRKSAKHLVERKIMRIFAAEYHKYITNMRTVRQNSINNVTFHSQVNKDAPNVTTLQAMSECESGKELEELTIDNINNLEEYISKL